MVNSRFEYVKQFEAEEKLLRDTFICVDINATDFDKFCIDHNFLSPFDDRIIKLNAMCARHVMEDFSDIDICFGFECEFSFIFKRTTEIFNRRRDKILTNLVSLFASTFTYKWGDFFKEEKLKYPPTFFASITLFPRLRTVKDYLLFQQLKATQKCANKYATNVLERMLKYHCKIELPSKIDIVLNTEEDIQKLLDTLCFSDINEIFFHHGINFNSLPDWHKRGKLLFRNKKIIETSDDLSSKKKDFWKKNKKLLKD